MDHRTPPAEPSLSESAMYSAVGAEAGGEGADVPERVRAARQRVYGDPLRNHQGIAMMWAPLLAPWWERIRNQEPIPPHVVSLLLVALKVDRMRLVHHADNFVDLENYARFTAEWQADQTTYGRGSPPDTSR